MTPQALICSGSCTATVAALCCFTPLGVIALGAIGLAVLVPALDIILLPALGLSLGVIILGLWRLKRRDGRADT